MSWSISRPAECPLNGREYVLDDTGEAMKFPTMVEAKQFLAANGYCECNIEDEGIDFEETE